MKYKFQATYKDGTTYVQNDEDISLTDPTRSCFYDVDQKNLRSFFLYNDEHTYSVNLEDGHFEVDGVPFTMHEENDNLKDFRIVFWRRHTHDFEVSKEKNTETRHDVVYRFGWQCTVPSKIGGQNKNYQEIMQIF